MHMGGFHPPPIPSALPAAVSIAPKNLNPFSVLRMRPTRICVVKFHRQKQKEPNTTNSAMLLQCRLLRLGWQDFNLFQGNPSAPSAVEIEKTDHRFRARFQKDFPAHGATHRRPLTDNPSSSQGLCPFA